MLAVLAAVDRVDGPIDPGPQTRQQRRKAERAAMKRARR